MKNVRILDCTLRDGGRVINCEFPDKEIQEMTGRLTEAGIDVVEIGFIRDQRVIDYRGNSTFFTDVEQIIPFLPNDRKNTIFTAFVDFGMYDIDSLKEYNGKSVDAIRFGFTKKDFDEEREEVIRWANVIKQKGYRLFIQGVNSLNYSDAELLGLIQMVNEIHPYSFGIVDTYGAMYMDDVDRLYGLINRNMSHDICVNFHSHNNYQLSFAFAQEIVKISENTNRNVIIDGTLGGMGKVAGNLNTELITEFLVRKKYYNYDIDSIFDLIDEYIYKYEKKCKWGYSVPGLMAGIHKSHPNNVIYLTEKFSLQSKDIGRILSMIDEESRQRYNYDEIERLYIEYTSSKIIDRDSVEQLRKAFVRRDVMILVPGNSLNTEKRRIDNYISDNDVVVISVNFVDERDGVIAFFGNERAYKKRHLRGKDRKIIITSNIKSESANDIIVDYSGLINRGYKYFENSTLMLLNLLDKVGVSSIIFAGFDGFNYEKETNYNDPSFQNDRYVDRFGEMNAEIKKMFDEYMLRVQDKCNISFLTPSIFDNKFSEG